MTKLIDFTKVKCRTCGTMVSMRQQRESTLCEPCKLEYMKAYRKGEDTSKWTVEQATL